MRTLTRRLAHTALLSLAVGWGVAACGGEDGGLGPGSAVVGTWNATTFVVQGNDLIAQGMSMSFTYTSGGDYSFSVTNDQGGLCDSGPNCSDSGVYTASGTQITLDPGTADVVVLNYTIAGNVMTINATIDGTALTATFAKA